MLLDVVTKHCRPPRQQLLNMTATWRSLWRVSLAYAVDRDRSKHGAPNLAHDTCIRVLPDSEVYIVTTTAHISIIPTKPLCHLRPPHASAAPGSRLSILRTLTTPSIRKHPATRGLFPRLFTMSDAYERERYRLQASPLLYISPRCTDPIPRFCPTVRTILDSQSCLPRCLH